MICEDITNSGVMGKPEEWFLSWNPEENKDWRTELLAVKAKGSTENGIFAVKLMANQLRQIDACLSGLVGASESGPYPHLRELLKNAAWIWVRRQDTVDQAISHYVAQKRGIYHTVAKTSGFVPGSSVTTEGFSRRDVDIPYDFQAILSEWSRIERDNLVWRSFFNDTGIEPMIIWYEEANENVAAVIARHAGLVGDIRMAPRNLVKMPSSRNKELKRQFLSDLFASA